MICTGPFASASPTAQVERQACSHLCQVHGTVTVKVPTLLVTPSAVA